jgi:hypothetical protein
MDEKMMLTNERYRSERRSSEDIKRFTPLNLPGRVSHLASCIKFINPWDIEGSNYKLDSNNTNAYKIISDKNQKG